jgi:hypothetical protein
MGKKIIKVDLNFPEKTEEAAEPAEETEALVAPSDGGASQEESVEEEPVEPVVVQAKPKRKVAAKKVVEQHRSEAPKFLSRDNVSTEPEPLALPPPEPEPVAKTQDLVKCQHCNKEMSTKSLKYSHSKNCLGLKKTIEKVSNEKASKASQKATPKQAEAPKPQGRIAKADLDKAPPLTQPEEHPRVARMKAAKEKYNHLVKNAFNV